VTFEEVVVVTASKVEQALVNVPATMTVIDQRVLASAPVQHYGDLLRQVPGVNVSQLSARDVNVTSRGATSSLSTGQLALVDGRTIYQDFFGFVAWDFLPINFSEIKQIEVIRGPASAVWGANALYGVVNVITKTPREMAGTHVTLGVGGFDRSPNASAGGGTGSLFSVNGTYAQAVNDRWAYKLSAGVFTMDPLPRPTGTIDNAFKTAYPPYQNKGTTQPKFDVRVDWDGPDHQRVVMSGGLAGTDGIMQSGIGPFDIQRGSVLGYAKMNYSRGALKANVFVNILDGDATNLLALGPTGQPITFVFKNTTLDAEFGNAHALGTRQVVTYGGNIRHNGFDLSIAPGEDARNEGGFYVQDELFLHEKFRAILGTRVDWFDVLDGAVVSPRVALVAKPHADHAVRVSYNRAYRAPSMINNFLDVTIANQIDLGLINPLLAGTTYVFPVAAQGNPNLKEVVLDAYELGYTGRVGGRVGLSAAVYRNIIRDDIFFTQVGVYTSRTPPPRWPLPPVVLDLLVAAGRGLPSRFTYLNFGRTEQWGLELGASGSVTDTWRLFANYSYQAEPEVNFDKSEINLPPKHRFNAGVGFDDGRAFGNVDVAYTDKAFWQDVLDARFHGYTKAWTMVNAAAGVRFGGERFTASLKVTNLANRAIQQHIFGDVLRRQVVGELRASF
jgi:outer membrane receptor protein involved in Fe transport